MREIEKWLKCVDNDCGDYHCLTVGNVYHAVKEDDDHVYIVDDNDEQTWYPNYLFEETSHPDSIDLESVEEEEVRHITNVEKELLHRGMCLLEEDTFKALGEAVEERDFSSVKTIVSELESIAGLLELFE